MNRCLVVLISIFTASGCGSHHGSGEDDAGIDGDDGGSDASVDAPPAPATILLTGAVTARGAGGPLPVSGATVAVYASANEATPLASTTSGNSGSFTLAVTTGGVAIDGYIKSSLTNYKTTYHYPPTPLAADTSMIRIVMVTTQGYSTLGMAAGVTQANGNGLIELVAVNTMAVPVAGATASSTPAAGAVLYDGPAGSPNMTATATAVDGIAYLFNMPPGSATVSAAKTGATFKSHALKVHADDLTTTLVTE